MLRPLCFLLILLYIIPAPTASASKNCPGIASSSAKQRMAQLEEEIRIHNGLYYKRFRPVISDADYDRLCTELVQLERCFPVLAAADSPTRTVGSDADPKVKSLLHERPMLSLSSSTGPEAVEAMLQRAAAKEGKIKLLVQPKVDGLPVELRYLDGRLVSATTRGDGRLGADVTKRAKQISGIPLKLSGRFPRRVTVRGEVYADRTLLAKAPGSLKKYATPRHFAAATLKSRHPAPQAVAALRLFPFELLAAEEVSGITSDLAAMRLLSLWGFPVRLDLMSQLQSMDEISAAYRKYLGDREGKTFAADGIVVKIDDLSLRGSLGEGSRAPFWAAAWKFPPEIARTVVREIRWKVGRTGRRTPVAEVDPISLGGVRISRVSLHNEQAMERLRIAPGDRIVVALVGDIIPQVLEVEKRAEDSGGPAGEPAKAQESGTAACLTDAPGCRERFLARAVHFVSKNGLAIRGLGPSRLRKLVEAGLVHDLPSLLRLQSEQMEAVEGFGSETAKRLSSALRQVKHPDPFRLLSALGIPGVGPAAASRLAREFDSLDALLVFLADAPDPGAAGRNIRSFFDSPQGEELLKGLRDLDLL